MTTLGIIAIGFAAYLLVLGLVLCALGCFRPKPDENARTRALIAQRCRDEHARESHYTRSS